jgi:hypothetical protein
LLHPRARLHSAERFQPVHAARVPEPVFWRLAEHRAGLAAGTLETGQSVTGWLEFEIGPSSSDVFLDTVDEGGSTLLFVALF